MDPSLDLSIPTPISEPDPIKKTFDFYKTTGNLWDSKYLTSPKIARYYHNIQDTFLSGPNSPLTLSLKDSQEKSKIYAEKAQSHKRESQELLKKRKKERLLLTGNLMSESLNNRQKTEDYRVTPKNAWERLNSVPACNLRHVMPGTIVHKDLTGIDNIFSKSSQIDKLNNWLDHQRQGKRLKARLAVINRHNDLKSLEEKCGIIKIREKSAPQGTFGYVKRHKVRQRTEELSKPRTAGRKGRFDHQDFRGLLHADFYEAVEKMKTLSSH
jgi:hypothetical protein